MIDKNTYPHDNFQESKLISLLADDSAYAFQLIYNHYHDRIYRVALSYLKSPVLSQEAVQDIFLKLWFYRKNIYRNRSLEPWLLTVTKNHLLNQLKSIAHQWVNIQCEYNDSGISALQKDFTYNDIQYKEYKQYLRKAIDSLTDSQRKVFLLSREEGLTYLQIAQNLNISVLTVKTHMSRALSHIKEYLKQNNLLFLIFFSTITLFLKFVLH